MGKILLKKISEEHGEMKIIALSRAGVLPKKF